MQAVGGENKDRRNGKITFVPWCAQDRAGRRTSGIPPCGTAVTYLAGLQRRGGQETRATATDSARLTNDLGLGKGSSTPCAELSAHPSRGSFGTKGHGDLSVSVAWCTGEQAHHGPHPSPRGTSTEGMGPQTWPSETPSGSKAFLPSSPFALPS